MRLTRANQHMDNSRLTDEDLLNAWRTDGDNRRLGTLLQRYTTLLYGVAMKYLHDTGMAEDAVQQVFEKVLTHLPQDGISNFKGWLYVLMRNHCLQLLRDRGRFTSDEVLPQIASHTEDAEEVKWQEYTLRQLEEAITELAAGQRTCIELFYLKKNSYEQIIAQTGYTFMQVKSYIQNGKRNLKTLLLKRTGRRAL